MTIALTESLVAFGSPGGRLIESLDLPHRKMAGGVSGWDMQATSLENQHSRQMADREIAHFIFLIKVDLINI